MASKARKFRTLPGKDGHVHHFTETDLRTSKVLSDAHGPHDHSIKFEDGEPIVMEEEGHGHDMVREMDLIERIEEAREQAGNSVENVEKETRLKDQMLRFFEEDRGIREAPPVIVNVQVNIPGVGPGKTDIGDQ